MSASVHVRSADQGAKRSISGVVAVAAAAVIALLAGYVPVLPPIAESPAVEGDGFEPTVRRKVGGLSGGLSAPGHVGDTTRVMRGSTQLRDSSGHHDSTLLLDGEAGAFDPSCVSGSIPGGPQSRADQTPIAAEGHRLTSDFGVRSIMRVSEILITRKLMAARCGQQLAAVLGGRTRFGDSSTLADQFLGCDLRSR